MTNPKKTPQERRQDYARRLKTAVKKAHDPLFSVLKNPPEEPRPLPTQR
jgi:hypothetical protein